MITLRELRLLKRLDTVKLACSRCSKPFKRTKKVILAHLKNRRYKKFYCSNKCLYLNEKGEPWISVLCLNCKKPFLKYRSQLKKWPKSFCSKSCRCQHQQRHKTFGTKRSKLEKWIAPQLQKIYPNLTILFNDRQTINAELDIFFPTLKLAIELNGILHYEPIFGKEKLSYIQNNDQRKFQACLEKGIELIILDTSTMINFKEEKAKQYLSLLTPIIETKLISSR